MPFFIKNTAGPGNGFFPDSDEPVFCINRSGSAIAMGDPAMLVMSDQAALATASQINTSDSNSYRPGAGDASQDSVWNTVVDSTAVGIQQGGYFGVCLDASIADDAVGKFQFYGIVEKAFCISDGNLACGDPLTIAIATESFDGDVLSNEQIFATYIDIQDASISTRALKRIFLHGGTIGGRISVVNS